MALSRGAEVVSSKDLVRRAVRLTDYRKPEDSLIDSAFHRVVL